MFIVGILGFIIGEGISGAIRRDTTSKGDDLGLTWVLKVFFAFLLMGLVYAAC